MATQMGGMVMKLKASFWLFLKQSLRGEKQETGNSRLASSSCRKVELEVHRLGTTRQLKLAVTAGTNSTAAGLNGT